MAGKKVSLETEGKTAVKDVGGLYWLMTQIHSRNNTCKTRTENTNKAEELFFMMAHFMCLSHMLSGKISL